jgi:NTE family protein
VDLDPLNVRHGVGLLSNARRTLLPLPLIDRPRPPASEVLPPFEERPAPVLEGRRVGVAASGNGVGIIGMARALEEAGVRPSRISACSGSVLWAAMWAAGTSADEMADYALAWRPEHHLGVQWLGLPRLLVSGLRGFSGLSKGEALEHLFPREVWRMSAGHTEVPLHTFARDLDRGDLVELGTRATPAVTLGEIACVAVARPRRSDAVRIEGRFHVDAAALGPLGDDDELDAVLQPPAEGAGLYELFIDRRSWPRLIRQGYDVTRRRLSASPS